jgi:biopolymer transport protein ExbB/TolQ
MTCAYAQEVNMLGSLSEFFKAGGVFMYPILFGLCLGIAIILERLYFLFYKYNVNGSRLFQQIKMYVQKGNLNEAIRICDDSPLPAILKAGLIQYKANSQDVSLAVEEATLEMTPKIQKRTHYLAAIANVATLLGLLGTVAGLIVAFHAISGAEPGEKATLLAKGIANAMNCTCFGLILAIPCLFFHSVLQSKTNRLLDDIEEYSTKTINLLHLLGTSTKG